MTQERARLHVNPPSIKSKALQSPRNLFVCSAPGLISSYVLRRSHRMACEQSAGQISNVTYVCEFALCKHTVGRWGAVCSISDCLMPSITSVGPTVRVPRQSCVNRGSTVVITAGSDETHCLRVRGEVCLLDCAVCRGCWLCGKLSCVRVREMEDSLRQKCVCVHGLGYCMCAIRTWRSWDGGIVRLVSWHHATICSGKNVWWKRKVGRDRGRQTDRQKISTTVTVIIG